MAIEFISEILCNSLIFGLNNRAEKEMHTVVICRIILYCQSQTILYVNNPSYLVFNINDDNLLKKNLEHYVYKPF